MVIANVDESIGRPSSHRHRHRPKALGPIEKLALCKVTKVENQSKNLTSAKHRTS